MRFLVFTLYGPIGSFGETAVGERRLSWARPARSAVLGLVAAAQGIERSDDAAHRHLEASLWYAIRTDSPGRPLLDYHTAQMPGARRRRTFATRREELSVDDLNTVVSSREWRSDAFHTVVLWPRVDGAFDLDEIAGALRRPSFTLYVGRKAAPLGLPLNPAIIDAATFTAALENRQPNDEERAVLRCIRGDGAQPGSIAFDADAPGAPEDSLVERRRDAVSSRVRWQFVDRLEGVVGGRGET